MCCLLVSMDPYYLIMIFYEVMFHTFLFVSFAPFVANLMTSHSWNAWRVLVS